MWCAEVRKILVYCAKNGTQVKKGKEIFSKLTQRVSMSNYPEPLHHFTPPVVNIRDARVEHQQNRRAKHAEVLSEAPEGLQTQVKEVVESVAIHTTYIVEHTAGYFDLRRLRPASRPTACELEYWKFDNF